LPTTAKDLWTGAVTGERTFAVPAHGVRRLELSPGDYL
jgi:hypothetical protein